MCKEKQRADSYCGFSCAGADFQLKSKKNANKKTDFEELEEKDCDDAKNKCRGGGFVLAFVNLEVLLMRLDGGRHGVGGHKYLERMGWWVV